MQPVEESSNRQKIPEEPKKKGRWSVLGSFSDAVWKKYASCVALLKKWVDSFKQSILGSGEKLESLPIYFYEAKPGKQAAPTMEALCAAHLRFHRFDLDPAKHPESLTILVLIPESSYHSRA